MRIVFVEILLIGFQWRERSTTKKVLMDIIDDASHRSHYREIGAMKEKSLGRRHDWRCQPRYGCVTHADFVPTARDRDDTTVPYLSTSQKSLEVRIHHVFKTTSLRITDDGRCQQLQYY
jgi:hypothetical protein